MRVAAALRRTCTRSCTSRAAGVIADHPVGVGRPSPPHSTPTLSRPLPPPSSHCAARVAAGQESTVAHDAHAVHQHVTDAG